MEIMEWILDQFNLKKRCSEYRVGLWQCPQFLFMVMGVVIIVAIEATYAIAQQFADPEIAALVVLALAAFLFIMGHLVVGAFEQVAHSARSKSEFIGIMSHQLRTPLSAVKWQLDMLLSEKMHSNFSLSGETTKYLEGIGDQNEHMIQMVNDLLDVNRIEDRDVVLRPSSFSLFTLSTQVVRHYEHFASANNVHIVVHDGVQLPNVWGDEERIKSVIQRFVDNAIKYSPQGGEVSINIKQNGSMVEWRITDQGVGIDPSDRVRLFEKFFRSTSSVRYQTKGSGVGLFIAKAMVILSGGAIGFQPHDHQGSTFWFSLPVYSGTI